MASTPPVTPTAPIGGKELALVLELLGTPDPRNDSPASGLACFSCFGVAKTAAPHRTLH
ncbi:hypothetical protein [Streptomyces sp. NPDC048606]|uniref:hypothetical protein n=1 Tax=Streptomyces sp. NPDC048606 TaxID=3154726 RepID=UPI0034444864